MSNARNPVLMRNFPQNPHKQHLIRVYIFLICFLTIPISISWARRSLTTVANWGIGPSTAPTNVDCAVRSAGGTRIPNHLRGSVGFPTDPVSSWLSLDPWAGSSSMSEVGPASPSLDLEPVEGRSGPWTSFACSVDPMWSSELASCRVAEEDLMEKWVRWFSLVHPCSEMWL